MSGASWAGVGAGGDGVSGASWAGVGGGVSQPDYWSGVSVPGLSVPGLSVPGVSVPGVAAASVAGDGAAKVPLVFTDGLGCDGFIWKYAFEHYEAGAAAREHLHWNYRGHGRSGVPEDLGTMTIEQCCDDLLHVLNACRIERAVFAGHSMGVQVSLEMQRRFPERVAGLVLICGSHGRPLASFHGTDLMEKLLPYVHGLMERIPSEAEQMWAGVFASAIMPKLAKLVEVNDELCKEDDVRPYFEHLSRMRPEVFLRMLEDLQAHSAYEHLPMIGVPTLVVAGDRDKFTPMSLSVEMAGRIPDGELVVLRGGSHVAPIELPGELHGALDGFLARRVDGAGVGVGVGESVGGRVA